MVERRIPGVTVTELTTPAHTGTKEVWYGTAQTVVKYDPDEPGRSALVAVEFICTRMAMMLGLPVPMGDAAEFAFGTKSHKAWVSAEIALEGVVLPPADPNAILERWPEELAGTFVFDVWIHNEDRTDENVLYDPGIGYWIIDHENALGGEHALTPSRLADLTRAAARWHLLSPSALPSDSVRRWTTEIGLGARKIARQATTEALRRRLITREEQTAIIRLLSHRGDTLSDLVRRSTPSSGGSEEKWPESSEPGTLFSSPPIFVGENPGTSD